MSHLTDDVEQIKKDISCLFNISNGAVEKCNEDVPHILIDTSVNTERLLHIVIHIVYYVVDFHIDIFQQLDRLQNTHTNRAFDFHLNSKSINVNIKLRL